MVKEEIRKAVEEKMEQKGIECKVSYQTVTKNNGVTLVGITIKEPGRMTAPVIYIDDEIDEIVDGKLTPEKAAEIVADLYMEERLCVMTQEAEKEIQNITKETILNNVKYAVVNEKKNRKHLAKIPHKIFLDLAVIYKVDVCSNEEREAKFTLDSAFMERKGIDFAELDAAAEKNTREKSGFFFKSLEEVLFGIERGEEEEDGCAPMLMIASNKSGINGAAVLLFNDIFNHIADRYGTDLFVLPSSIHEVLAVPYTEGCADDYRQMVRIVNSTGVQNDEILSDNVYIYDRTEQRFLVA